MLKVLIQCVALSIEWTGRNNYQNKMLPHYLEVLFYSLSFLLKV